MSKIKPVLSLPINPIPQNPGAPESHHSSRFQRISSPIWGFLPLPFFLSFVHPFDDPMTIAGQGTIGLEILDDLPDADVILVPVGGGGLISGIAVAVKGIRPSARVIGVEPKNAPSMVEALKRNTPTAVQVIPTIAEGTAVSKVGNTTHTIVRELIDELITVSEEEILEAMLLLLLKDKVLTEGAGALGAAALLSGKLDVKGKKVVIVISGGNIDLEELKVLLERVENIVEVTLRTDLNLAEELEHVWRSGCNNCCDAGCPEMQGIIGVLPL